MSETSIALLSSKTDTANLECVTENRPKAGISNALDIYGMLSSDSRGRLTEKDLAVLFGSIGLSIISKQRKALGWQSDENGKVGSFPYDGCAGDTGRTQDAVSDCG